MTNVFALNRILPAISIETDCLARISGSRPDNELNLVVPPAGWIEGAVSVTDLLAFAVIEAGHARAEVNSIAAGMASALLAKLPLERRPVMFGWPSDMQVCCSVSDGARALSTWGRKEAEVAETLNWFADEAACACVFAYGEFGQSAHSLRKLGPGPLQSGLTEFWSSVSVELCVALGESNTPAEVGAQGV